MLDKKKHIVVLGAGESGLGAALLAKRNGYNVFISDKGKIAQEHKDVLLNESIEWEEEVHSEDRIFNADVVVKSPGIPKEAPLIVAIKNRGIELISEIEFASYFSRSKKICVTGSNGKTTTSLLVYHILKKAGIDVGLAGNIGSSFAKQIANGDHDWFVLELSSFQLDDLIEFKADIAILLNITPDHLDRYEYNMDLYAESKFRILMNMDQEGWFIYNLDDPIITKKIQEKNPQMKQAPFSLQEELERGAFLKKEELIININDQLIMSIHDLALKGKHNAQNSLAAGIASRIIEIRKDIVRESLGDFVNVEHRLEFVAKVNGIEFINDSKATNINSTWFALESMDKPVVWVVGGVDKGNDYSELLELVKDKVKAIVCLGTDNSKIKEAFSDTIETIVEAQSAKEAVAYGYRLAKKDECVLLSPACASFDLFENYEDRGNQFKHAVRML